MCHFSTREKQISPRQSSPMAEGATLLLQASPCQQITPVMSWMVSSRPSCPCPPAAHCPLPAQALGRRESLCLARGCGLWHGHTVLVLLRDGALHSQGLSVYPLHKHHLPHKLYTAKTFVRGLVNGMGGKPPEESLQLHAESSFYSLPRATVCRMGKGARPQTSCLCSALFPTPKPHQARKAVMLLTVYAHQKIQEAGVPGSSFPATPW